MQCAPDDVYTMESGWTLIESDVIERRIDIKCGMWSMAVEAIIPIGTGLAATRWMTTK